jgi:8-oxo-dGTP pyrophosphatase MutT (NUDIX family)
MFKEIKNYIPINEQESIDKKAMLDFIDHYDNTLSRENLIAHFTSSAIVLNKDFTKILFAYHKIFDSWGWVGGHNDGDPDFKKVALKEAREETGIEEVFAFDEILGLDTIYVPKHIKRGHYVPDHLHMNVTYLLIADENQAIMHKPDENLDVRWFTLDECMSYVSEPHMLPIYEKLMRKALTFKS